jgi:hypothetical protein
MQLQPVRPGATRQHSNSALTSCDAEMQDMLQARPTYAPVASRCQRLLCQRSSWTVRAAVWQQRGLA